MSKSEQNIVAKNVMSGKKYLIAGAVVLLAVSAGCHFYGQKEINGGLPAVNATVEEAREMVINNPKHYVALVEAINSVDVVAKVGGSLDKVNFKEGGFVGKDDALFVIDKDTYQAKYDLAKAQLESAKANLTKTERDYKRQTKLSAKNIASQATFDSAESAYLQAKAAVAQNEANLKLAKKDLDNTEVKAYIDGVIGKTYVTVGNYIKASDPDKPLARVVQVNPIRIAFSLTDKEYLALKAAGKQNLSDYNINIELANGKILIQKMDNVFASNEVKTGTASVAVYVDVENNEGLLKPGAYVKMFITSANPQNGVVVSEKSIVQAEGDSYVYAVVSDKENKHRAQKRKVILGETFDGKQVILEGVKAGERIMVGGLSNRMLFDGAELNIFENK